jgi:magnesium transporter
MILKQIPNYNFTWIDVSMPSDAELKSLALQYSLPLTAVSDCLQSDHLPKVEQIGEYTFAIFRVYDVQADENAGSFQKLTRKIAVFYTKDFLLTIHRSPTQIIENVAQKYIGNPLAQSPFEVVCKLYKNVLESFQTPLQLIDREIDVYEERIFLKKRIPDLLKNLYAIKRKTYLIKRLNLINKMVIELMPLNHHKPPFYGDLHDCFIGHETLTDEIYDSIQSLLNLYLTISSQKTNEVMRILTAFSAFFLPLTFIVGVYGMNFDYMPELHSVNGYPMVLLGMTAISIAIWIWFKRRAWL